MPRSRRGRQAGGDQLLHGRDVDGRVQPTPQLAQDPLVAAGAGRRRESGSGVIDEIVKIGRVEVLLLQIEGAGQNQVGQRVDEAHVLRPVDVALQPPSDKRGRRLAGPVDRS